jgi:uracil-DNA glycosylase
MTNSVLCLPGGESMRTRVRESEVRTCATTFLGETLGIVRPRVVASLGNHAMRAVMYAYDVSPSRARVSEARADQGLRLPDGSVLFAMPHPVASKTVAQHEAAWRRIRCWLESGGSEA